MTELRNLDTTIPVSQEILDRRASIADIPNTSKIISFTDVTQSQQETPGSTAVATKDVIYPELTSEVMNCGFSLIKTDLQQDDLTADFVEKFCTELDACVPAFKPDREDVIQMLSRGAEFVVDAWNCSPEMLDHIENGGCMFTPEERPEDVTEFIPSWLLRYNGTYKETPISHLRGNHFIEFQRVDEIVDDATAREWGLSEDQIVIFLHGDYLLTYYIFMHYTNRKKFRESSSIATKTKLTLSKSLFHLLKRDIQDLPRQWRLFNNDGLFTGFETSSEEGHLFSTAMYMGMNFAYANRLLWMLVLQEAIGRTVPEKGTLELLWDVGHDTIQQERIDGEDYWIHRKATGNAVPGKPAPITGSYNMNSFLGKGLPTAEKYLNSYDHGCQRVIDYFERNDKIREGEGATRRYTRSGILEDEVKHIDPQPIEAVVHNLTENEILSEVAWLTPVVNISE